VGIVEYRDGTIIDVIHQLKEKWGGMGQGARGMELGAWCKGLCGAGNL
jgi:hypothetical protein